MRPPCPPAHALTERTRCSDLNASVQPRARIQALKSSPPVCWAVCSVVSGSWRPHGLKPTMEFPRQEYWSGLPFPSPGVMALGGNEVTGEAASYRGLVPLEKGAREVASPLPPCASTRLPPVNQGPVPDHSPATSPPSSHTSSLQKVCQVTQSRVVCDSNPNQNTGICRNSICHCRLLSRVHLFVTPQAAACQAPLSSTVS